jgi:hypothetical protein
MFQHSPYFPQVETAILAATEAAAAVRDLYDRHAAVTYTKGTARRLPTPTLRPTGSSVGCWPSGSRAYRS